MNLYPFIEAEKAQQRNVKRACELLEVSRAAYYANRADSPSTRQLVDQELTEHIRQAHQTSKGRYGAPRIHAELRRRGHRHGRKRVARLMRQRDRPFDVVGWVRDLERGDTDGGADEVVRVDRVERRHAAQ